MREIKGGNFSCTSPSLISTGTQTSINHNSILMTNSGIGGRAIDRCSPHLRDPLRSKSLPRALPNKPRTSNQKGKKSTPSDSKRSSAQAIYGDPASSRRYLLSDGYSEDFFEQESVDFVTVNEPLRFQSPKVEELWNVADEYPSMFQNAKIESSPSSSTPKRAQVQQVVVLRVSLHCKGCEGKVRKHISKMEGVTSFSTDLVNKKVTVVGEVTPLGVLNSISKVKNAQLCIS